jgi:general secretion pathway protein D
MKKYTSLLLNLLLLVSLSAHSLTLNLKNTDLIALINTVSKITGKNFIIDSKVKGKVNVVSARDIDEKELYQLFLSILQVNGYVAIEGDQYTKILPNRMVKTVGPTLTGATDLVITTTIKIEHVQASQLVPVLRPIISKNGHFAAYTPANSIVVTDTKSNIARLERIISELDKEIDKDYEIITLKNASVDTVSKIIKTLMPPKKGAVNPLTLAVDRRSNQLIVGGSVSERLKLRFLVAELDKHQAKHGDTTVIYLKYTDAKKILPILQNITKQQGNRTDAAPKNQVTNIQADEITNAIIITASVSVTNNVKSIIDQLDIRRAQVLIEAVIAEISSSNSQELGIQWLSKNGASFGLLDFTGQIPAILSVLNGESTVPTGGKQGFTYGHTNAVNGGNGMTVVLNALNSLGGVNILSTPSIVTLDNEEAMIMVGQEVPFITNTEYKANNPNPFQSYERKNVGLTLRVKPQINEGDTIKLGIELEISNLLPSTSGAADLITSKREIKNSVMVDNNKILVLGGLIDDVWRDTKSGLPLLGDIPILGELFNYSTTTKEKRNLLIFIHPTILKDQAIADSVSAQKYKYLHAQSLIQGSQDLINLNTVNLYGVDINNPVLKQAPNTQDKTPPWMSYE